MARRLGLVRRIESVERGQQCLLLGGAQAPNGAADYAGGIVPQELRIAVKDAYRAAHITQAQAAKPPTNAGELVDEDHRIAALDPKMTR